eukprot:scaffold307583_cov32-Tisochrysis_lutea.AAC.6
MHVPHNGEECRAVSRISRAYLWSWRNPTPGAAPRLAVRTITPSANELSGFGGRRQQHHVRRPLSSVREHRVCHFHAQRCHAPPTNPQPRVPHHPKERKRHRQPNAR